VPVSGIKDLSSGAYLMGFHITRLTQCGHQVRRSQEKGGCRGYYFLSLRITTEAADPEDP
jgi:hypothetical protein